MSLSVTGDGVASAALRLLRPAPLPAVPSAPPAGPVATARGSPSVVMAGGRGELFSAVAGVGRALRATAAAGAAGGQVLSLLQAMRDSAAQAADPALQDAARAALDAGFQDSARAVGQALASARVDGVNLIDGSLQAPLSVPVGGGASTSVQPHDLTLHGPTLGLASVRSVATATAAAGALDALAPAIGVASGALAGLADQGRRLALHGAVLGAFGQALAKPADDTADSARLLALQLGQQIAAAPSAIANQTPQAVLSLIKGG